MRVIDCEWTWTFPHEDLRLNQGGVVVGGAFSEDNHGTVVLGEMSGDVNSYGVTGIAPEATVFGAAFPLPTAQVIQQAVDRPSAGDICLLEVHRHGPGASGVDQDGFIAIEWWPDDYLAIRYAGNRGVIVVEAAGNGARNLDDPIYDHRPAGFSGVVEQPHPPQPSGYPAVRDGRHHRAPGRPRRRGHRRPPMAAIVLGLTGASVAAYLFARTHRTRQSGPAAAAHVD